MKPTSCPAAVPNWPARRSSNFIGVPIPYYVVMDFYTVIKIIDEVGGVEVRPFQDVKVEKFGGGEQQELLAGHTYTIDGRWH